ncbi:DUF4352 domain-containing protein [Sphaerisporangium sp. NPDC005288]|uniref:DUF4352 domain-containing protein n=1 Tax=Sphaerisporangium sp. NPDC005288 TaxID=3155114 RepID=UPI0033A19E9D
MSQPYGPPMQQGHYGYPALPPKKKKTGLKIFLGLVVLLVLMGGCMAIIVGNAPSGTTTAQATDKPSKSDPKTPADKKQDAERATPGIGKVVKDGKFAFKVTKLSKAARVGGQFLHKDAQGVFWLVNITVKNVGDEPQTFIGDSQKVFDAKGREYSASTEAAIYLHNSKSLYEEINPGNTVHGVVLFDLPKSVRADKIELHDSMFSGGVTVVLH